MDEQKRQVFREAMACLGAAVNVVTTKGAAGCCGITSTAVCSITDTPPTVMVCINLKSQMNPVFRANRRLCVNVLSREHETLAWHFAGMRDSTMEERFAWDVWTDGSLGQPMLMGALASLEGEIVQVQDIGTHSVFMVQMHDIRVLESDSVGLVYFNRQICPVLNEYIDNKGEE